MSQKNEGEHNGNVLYFYFYSFFSMHFLLLNITDRLEKEKRINPLWPLGTAGIFLIIYNVRMERRDISERLGKRTKDLRYEVGKFRLLILTSKRLDLSFVEVRSWYIQNASSNTYQPKVRLRNLVYKNECGSAHILFCVFSQVNFTERWKNINQ